MNKPIRKDVPVAWMLKTLDGRKLMLYGEEQPPKFEQEVQYIPLYTHPADLTDEEILEVYKNNPFIDGYLNKNLIEFARAILRKAQEK